MKIGDLSVGDQVFIKDQGQLVTVTSVGIHSVLVMWGTEEIRMHPEDLSLTREYPEMVINVYGPMASPSGTKPLPGRIFLTGDAARKDPDWQHVIGQIWLRTDGVVTSHKIV